MLKFIKGASHLPWVCIGDFNEVLHRDEHMVVDVCGLYDHGYEGRKWTFEKKIPGGLFCRVRLDLSLAMADWCLRFLQVRVSHLTAAVSDHEPINFHGRSKWDESNDSKIINSALLCQPFIILRLIQS